jgi:hypothetical protein
MERREIEAITDTRRRRMALGGALATAVVFMLLGPLADSAASLAIYDVRQCDPQHGVPNRNDLHYNRTQDGFFVIDDCGTAGAGVGIAFPPWAWTGAAAGWSIDAPAGTYFQEIELEGARRFSDNGWLARFIGWKTTGGYTELNVPGDGVRRHYPAGLDPTGPFTSLAAQLICGSYPSCSSSASAGITMDGLRLDVADASPPTVAASGSLFAGDVRRGIQNLTVAAFDQGGGLSSAVVLVNGIPGAAQSFTCSSGGGVATTLTPCQQSVSQTFNLDTQNHPFHDGSNSVQVCATDFATLLAPNMTCSPLKAVQVDNSCQPSSVDGGTQLSASFEDTDEAQIEVTSKKGATVIGRLTDDHGDGVGGATLCIRERTLLPDRNPWDVGTIQTDPDGYYKYRVDPGPNREVTILYRHDSEQIAGAVQFYSRAKPSLRLSDSRIHNGHTIGLTGTLPGPENAGRVVVFQAGVPGRGRWYTFRKAETDEHGRFEAKYRFRNTTQTTVYRMRVVVSEQNDYPYLSGRSGKRRITVVG